MAGAFELRKPYYNLDAGNRFDLLGEIINRDMEFSWPVLNIVAGGVLLRPRATGDGRRAKKLLLAG